MLLPTKGISYERALLTVGADILEVLATPASVSALWERFTSLPSRKSSHERITFDWFALALAMLFAIRSIEQNEDGRLRRRIVPT
ncbi:ABC-three component system middle component 6 [Arthrobacter oryzae]|uniref:ABC-three component system middle component 6 n=1 Tax=Arthrobacter oryzae TaxID=409290 RepID=UPI003593E16A